VEKSMAEKSLKQRVDRLDHWIWVIGTVAGILTAFGINLQINLGEVKKEAAMAKATAEEASRLARDAKKTLHDITDEEIQRIKSTAQQELPRFHIAAQKIIDEIKLNAMDGKECQEFITNPGFYKKVENDRWLNDPPPPYASYNHKDQVVTFMCPKGRYLGGARVFNNGPFIDRLYCCKF
jgi:hypothetical protein